jgi:hypothetical protein
MSEDRLPYETAAGNNTQESVAEPQENTRGTWLKPLMLRPKSYLIVVGLFTLVGVIGGYMYYSLVGCKTGGCAITSNPTMSIIWGGLMGYLVPDFFVKQKKA